MTTTTPIHFIDASQRYPDVAIGIVTLTPPIARQLLESNSHNRPVKPRKVEAWVRDIRAGNWDMNGESIKVAKDGTLLDGQNRLKAIIAADTAIDTIIVVGLPSQTQDTMDQGVKRTTADTLTLNGYKHAVELATTVGLLMKHELGRNIAPTAREVEDYVVEHSDVVDWLKIGVSYRQLIPELRASPMVAALTLLGRVDAYKTREFFEGMANNATDGVGDPRNTLLKRIRQDRARRVAVESFDQLNMIIRVWNAWRRGKTLAKIPYSSDVVKPV